jgi:hypothetical protein
MPLNAAVAGNIGYYRVIQPGRFRLSRPTMVRVLAARPGAATNTITLTLGRFLPGRPLWLVITGPVGAGISAAPIVTAL